MFHYYHILFGITLKFLSNVILISNENIGIKGAAIGNIICNATVCTIGYIILNKKVKINLKKIITKIIIGTFLMAVIAIFIYYFLKKVIVKKIATIIAISTGMSFYIVFTGFFGLLKRK